MKLPEPPCDLMPDAVRTVLKVRSIKTDFRNGQLAIESSLDWVMQARERACRSLRESPQGGGTWRGVSRERGGASTHQAITHLIIHPISYLPPPVTTYICAERHIILSAKLIKGAFT